MASRWGSLRTVQAIVYPVLTIACEWAAFACSRRAWTEKRQSLSFAAGSSLRGCSILEKLGTIATRYFFHSSASGPREKCKDSSGHRALICCGTVQPESTCTMPDDASAAALFNPRCLFSTRFDVVWLLSVDVACSPFIAHGTAVCSTVGSHRRSRTLGCV